MLGGVAESEAFGGSRNSRCGRRTNGSKRASCRVLWDLGAIRAALGRVVWHGALLLHLHGGQADHRAGYGLELKNQKQETREELHVVSVLHLDHRDKFCEVIGSARV